MIKLLFDVELDEDLSAGEDSDLLENVMTGAEVHDSTREKVKTEKGYYKDYVRRVQWTQNLVEIENSGFRIFYTSVAVISCALLIGMLLFTISFLPRYGLENPEGLDVVRRYVEHGLQETGAINIISGIILDYRAFDTLGESHVLFTALMCVTVLLRIDKKNMRTQYEDFYLIRDEKYHELYGESIMRGVAAVVGSGLIICAAAYGFNSTDRMITRKTAGLIAFFALGFYSFAKGYVFFTGANGIENHIPKGQPGAILSGGLILPLDIAVGLVVACTMFGFYSLFRRGSIGKEV